MSNVWKRTGSDAMSKNLYALAICFFTGVGIFVSLLIAQFTANFPVNLGSALVVLALGIAGIFLAHGSDKPVLSFAGYMLVAVPYGALLGPIINTQVQADLVKAFFITTVYVGIFGLIGAIIPDSLESWGTWIFAALLVGILGYFVIPIAGFFGLQVETALGVWDWLIVFLFAGIIMFDFNRAMRIPYTVDNAIDVALAVYLDWFNVFIRLLNRNNDD